MIFTPQGRKLFGKGTCHEYVTISIKNNAFYPASGLHYCPGMDHDGLLGLATGHAQPYPYRYYHNPDAHGYSPAFSDSNSD